MQKKKKSSEIITVMLSVRTKHVYIFEWLLKSHTKI